MNMNFPIIRLAQGLRSSLILTLLLLALLSSSKSIWASEHAAQLLACTDPLGCIEFLADSTVLVTGLHDLSTYVSLVGTEQSQGAALAAKEFETLLGRPIEYRPLDTRCDAATALRLLESQRTESNLLGIVGPTCNDVTQELILRASEMGTVMIAPGATRTAFTGSADPTINYWQPGFYSTASSDLHQAIATAQFALHNLGIRQLVIIGDGSQDSTQLSDVMSLAFQLQGGQVLEHMVMPASIAALNSLLEDLSNSNSIAIYLPISHQQALRFLQGVRGQTAFQDFPLLASSAWLESDVAQAVQGSNLTLYATGMKPRSYGNQTFLGIWQATYGSTPLTTAGPQAYDAMALLLQAARLVATKDSLGNVSIGRLALRQALTQMRGFPGVSGVLDCTQSGYCGADDAWATLQFTTGPALGAHWPPALVQHALPMEPKYPLYQGRSLQTQEIMSGPGAGFQQVGQLEPLATYQVRRASPDLSWLNLQAGGWIPASAIELFDVGLPVATNVPQLLVINEGEARVNQQIGHLEWPVPFRTKFEVADKLFITLTQLFREGDRGYSSTVPTSYNVSTSCPDCGHIGLRISLENKRPGTERTISIHDFQLILYRQGEGLADALPASVLRCRLNRFRNDQVVLRSFVGETERDLCFDVPDSTRVTWFYSLGFTSSLVEGSEGANGAETLHFSLQ